MSGYLQYYGLSVNPFELSPDSKFFFPSESHKEALASLLYVVKERKGFMLVVGEDGTGKTVLINHLLKCLDENVNVVFFPYGNLPFEQMLKEILIKLRLPPGRIIKGAMLHKLNEYLIENLARGKNLVLIIDEAQHISKDAMEELRLISNLETSTSKLLQIIFVGRPETETRLNTRGLRQLKQRIGTISRISRLKLPDSMDYIDHRLQQAGCHSDTLFSPEALTLICKCAGGVPRKINLLCHNALMKGFERSQKPIPASTARKIRNDDKLLTGKRPGDAATADGKKPRLMFRKESAWLKRSLYFCLTAGCILIALFIVTEYLKNVPETTLPVISPKPSAVSEEVKSEATAPSESADSPKQTVASARTGVRYKRIIDIGKGANLSSLILNNYNQVNATLMDFVMEFNPEIANPDLILIDQKIRIPEITESNLIAESSDGSIKAHLGTFMTGKEAFKYKNFINITDNEVEIIPQKISSDVIWFRVMAGPFTDETDCLKTIQSLRQRGLLPAFEKIPKI